MSQLLFVYPGKDMSTKCRNQHAAMTCTLSSMVSRSRSTWCLWSSGNQYQPMIMGFNNWFNSQYCDCDGISWGNRLCGFNLDELTLMASLWCLWNDGECSRESPRMFFFSYVQASDLWFSQITYFDSMLCGYGFDGWKVKAAKRAV